MTNRLSTRDRGGCCTGGKCAPGRRQPASPRRIDRDETNGEPAHPQSFEGADVNALIQQDLARARYRESHRQALRRQLVRSARAHSTRGASRVRVFAYRKVTGR